jgi:glycosyltransferase involved in cell wall biosynthesis/nucleoside-diphosphate-sugar epimerase
MMAEAFSAFAEDARVVIFASGVSNSLESDPAAFRREKELLQRTREAHPEALVVYFGTCSVHDPDRRGTPYVRHKVEMESLLADSPHPWLVLRLPLALGPKHRNPTLGNFLYEKISGGEPFEVWAQSTRYPIDVQDVQRIATRLIGDRSTWNRVINVALRPFPVLDFVRAMERITGKSARYTLTQKGSHYELHCPEVASLAEELRLDFTDTYLERTLRRYFAGVSPLISIVVSVFNGAGTLQKCLDSVAGQTHAGRELIVIDGGSTDGTCEILKRNAARLAYWVSEPDRGIYDAWNKGLTRARGDWICFLGADDYLWTPDTLERLAPVLERAYPPIRLVYGEVVVVNESGVEMLRVGEEWRTARGRFQQIMCLPHTGLMHHCSLFQAHGNFDASFRIGGDYELLLRELRTGDALFVPGLVVAGMRHGGVSSDPAGSLRLMREFRRAQVKHGLRRPGRHWRVAFAKAHLRVWLWRMLRNRVASRVFDFLRLLSGKKPYWTRQ